MDHPDVSQHMVAPFPNGVDILAWRNSGGAFHCTCFVSCLERELSQNDKTVFDHQKGQAVERA